MPRRFKDTATMVEYLMRTWPNTRGSDKILLVEFMQLAGMNLTPDQIEIFMVLPSPETITRCRRKVQEGGKYLPSEQITRERHEKAEMTKQEMIHWPE